MAEAKKFDRSKFKDTVTAEELIAQDQAVEKAAGGKPHDNDNGYLPYHKIEEGVNKFRIYPAHPNEKGHSFVPPLQRWWLEREVVDKDEKGVEKKDKSGEPLMIVVRKRVFDGRVHSKTGKDIVDEYIKYLTKTLKNDGLDEAAITEKMLPIYGKYSPVPAQRVNGIIGKTEWIMYAEKIHGDQRVMGKLPIGKAVKFRLNDLMAREGADDPIGSEATNPFTDPDDGRLFEVTYNGAATKAADYYKSEIDSSFDKDTKMIKLYPLSDDDLGEFMEIDSLHDLYVDNYTSSDFALAMEGLKNLDTKNNFGVFEYDEFLDICEKLSTIYPEAEVKEGEESKEDKSTPETTEVKTEEVDEFDFDSMNRRQLKIFNKKNNCGIIVTTKMTDPTIQEALYQWLDAQEKSLVEEEVEEEIEEEEEEIEEEVEDEEKGDLPWEVQERLKKEAAAKGDVKKVSAKDKIAALRKKSKAKK